MKVDQATVLRTAVSTVGVAVLGAYLLFAGRRKHGFKRSSPWFLPIDVFLLIRQGSMAAFVRSRMDQLKTDIFWIYFPGVSQRPNLVVANPKDQATLLAKEGKLKFYAELPDTVTLNHGEGNMQELSGRRHQVLRKVFSSLLSPRSIQAFVPHILAQFEAMWMDIEEQSKSGPIVIQDKICDAQFLLVAKLFLGLSPDTPEKIELLAQLREDFELQLNGHFAPMKSNQFKKGYEAAKRIQKYISTRFEDVLAKRREILETKDSKDLPVIGSAMESVADVLLKDGSAEDPLIVSDVKDNFNLLIEASHGTTMTVTTSAMYFLNHPGNKKSLELVQQEVGSVPNPGVEHLQDGMPYVESCIKETMRLAPIVGQIGYVMDEGMTVDFKGQTLSGPMTFTMAFAPNYKDPAFFPEPETFKPERWMKSHADEASEMAKLAYKPFGTGRHMCLGYKLAFVMMKASIYRFASNPKRILEYDTNRMKIVAKIFPDGSVSEGLLGQVIVS